MSKVQTGLRIDSDIHAKLLKVSQIENRTINNLVEYIIKLYLADYEQKHGAIQNP